MGKKSKRNKNKQQKSNGNRDQRTGQQTINRERSGYRYVQGDGYVKLPHATKEMLPLLPQDRADQVADVLLSPHRRHGLVPRLREKDALSSYLQDVFCVNAQLAFLFVERLLGGLVDEEGESINWRKQINDEGDEMSILALVCQWKQFEKIFGWKGKSEMVKIILAHPKIDVNECMPNGCNTAFHTLKYADAETLRCVIEAGCDLSKKDNYGNSLLKNAVEYPDPDVLQLLLEHVSPTETFPNGFVDENGSLEGKVLQYTAIDQIFVNYSGVKVPVSWRILGGPPPLEKIAECLVMLRQHGTKITFDPDMKHYRALSMCFESIPDAKRHQIHAAEDMKKLGECLLGVWFPPTIQSVIDSQQEKLACEEKDDPTSAFCALCKEEYNKPFLLYCGHSFCRDCIIVHGKHETTCPVCLRKLCLDVAPCRNKYESDVDLNEMHSNDGNVEHNWKDRQLTLIKGVKALSKEQIMAELSEYSLNFSSATALDTLMNKIKTGHQEFVRSACKTASMEITKGESAGETIQIGGPILEMTATDTMVREEMNVVLAPSHGPVWIEIVVKGMPILASISNNSIYTIVSPKFSETFKLKQIPNLTTSKMRCGMFGKRFGHSTCLEEFSFNIGPSKTEVKLRNVIESASFTETVGIQLGQDFLLSGRYCAVSVATSDKKNLYYTADGTCSYFDSTQKSESLRYYAHNGDIVKLPLKHFKPRFNHAQVLVVTVKEESTFHECNYCCRTFPKWKYSKCCDDVDYCDERCQKASRKVHKLRKPNCGN